MPANKVQFLFILIYNSVFFSFLLIVMKPYFTGMPPLFGGNIVLSSSAGVGLERLSLPKLFFWPGPVLQLGF